MKTLLKGTLHVAYYAAISAAAVVGTFAGFKVYVDVLEPKLDSVCKKFKSKD